MKKKAALAALLALALCLTTFLRETPGSHVEAKSEIKVIVSGKELPLRTQAFIENAVTMVPVRQIAEAIGADVGYDKSSDGAKTVTLKRGDRSAVLTIGSKAMSAGGRSIVLPAAPRSLNGVTLVPLRAISEALGAVVAWNGVDRVITVDEPLELPRIQSAAQLKKLLESASSWNGLYARATVDNVAVAAGENAAPAADGGSAPPTLNESAGAGGQDDYSSTNVQVEGVDEADWAKTDGRYVYQISGSRVLIADISDPNAPKLAATLEYEDKEGFYPQELYVDGGKLLVIGQQQLFDETPASSGASSVSSSAGTEPGAPAVDDAVDSAISAAPAVGRMIMPPFQTRSAVKTYVYELGQDGQPTLTRELVQEGSYLTSRKIGSALYIVTNKYSYFYPMYRGFGPEGVTEDGMEDGNADDEETARITQAIEPVYGDSAASDGLLTLPLDDVRYFPEPTDSSMMLVGAADLDQPEQPLQVSAYLGSGNTVYASQKHLYVALSKFKTLQDGSYEQETQFHKFRLDHGQTVYIGEGTVPGNLLNQFSMDEHEGYFRVALTKGDMWASGAQGSTNNLYVLDEKLSVVGKLEGLAPGERIYSARFMGGRAYMVTFRNIDPLFAIDLRNPTNPSVLGQLKIPGYSDYLHPYDENHMIGFGKDTIEIPSKGASPDDTIALAQGIKIALFDVSDVGNPKEKFKESIGDRGTDSELLYNHKALLFSKAKGLMAFPVQVHENTSGKPLDDNGFPAYGEFTYQGAYVYGIDLERGFQLRGRITHLSDDDLKKSGQYGYDYTKSVKRILYAGDTLYTLSEAMLKANDLNSLSERGILQYPALPAGGYWGGGVIDVMPMPFIIE